MARMFGKYTLPEWIKSEQREWSASDHNSHWNIINNTEACLKQSSVNKTKEFPKAYKPIQLPLEVNRRPEKEHDKEEALLSWILNYIPIRDSARAVMFTFVLYSGFPFLRNSKYWKLTWKAILKCAHQQLCVYAMHIMLIIHEYRGSREPDSLSRIPTQRR